MGGGVGVGRPFARALAVNVFFCGAAKAKPAIAIKIPSTTSFFITFLRLRPRKFLPVRLLRRRIVKTNGLFGKGETRS